MRKALILGAGGTGARVITKIANFIDIRRKENINDLEYVQYYEIDTASAIENEFLPNSSVNYRHMEVSPGSVDDFKKEYSSGNHKWMDREICNYLEAIDNGAAATRMRGKYAFLNHYDNIREDISLKLEKLLNAENSDNNQAKTQVYVVANIAAGTGSGCFVDLGVMVRDIIKKEKLDVDNKKLKVSLIITLPADYTIDRHLRNSYYALQELNHLMMGNPYQIDHINVNEPPISFDISNGKVFNHVYLVGRQSVTDNSRDTLETLISEYIYNDIYSSSADKRDAARVDLQMDPPLLDAVGQRPLYMSFGLSVIEYPSSNILEAASNKYIINSLGKWLQSIESTIGTRYENDYFEKGIYSDMQEACEYRNIRLNYADKLKRAKELAGKNFDRTRSSQPLRALVNSFNNCFDSADVFNETDGLQKGEIFRLLDENNKKLIENLCSRIKNEILENIFSGKPGSIAIAKRSLEIIKEKIDAATQIYETLVDSSDIADFEDIFKDIDSIGKAGVLKLFNASAVPMSKLYKDFSSKFEKYTNSKIKQEISRKLKLDRDNNENKLIYLLKKELDTFLKNIGTFERRMETWKSNTETNFNKALKTPDITGHVVNANEIGKLAQATYESTKSAHPNFEAELITEFLKSKYQADLMSKDEKDFKYTNNDIFYEVKSRHRNYIEDTNVIDAFLEEEKSKASGVYNEGDYSYAHQLVTGVHAKSACHLELIDRDNAYSIDTQLERNLQWVFYPDGKNINSDADAKSGKNKFAKILRDRGIIRSDGDWADKSQDSNSESSGSETDKTMILFLKERGLFPIRFLKILREPRLADAMKKDATVQARQDMTFAQLIPPDKTKQESVKKILLRCIVSEILTKRVSEFIINEKTIGKKLNDEDKEFKLPLHYRSAVDKLLEIKNGFDKLRTLYSNLHNDKKIDINYDVFLSTIVKNLHDLSENKGKVVGLVIDEEDNRQIKEIVNQELGNSPDWREKYTKLFGEIGESIPHSITVKKIERDDDVYTKPGWYCVASLSGHTTTDNDSKMSLCNYRLGDLDQEEAIKKYGMCDACKTPLKWH